MKYKIGDIVKLRDDLQGGNYYDDLYFAPEMKDMMGYPIKITRISNNLYETENKTGLTWNINDAMIEGLFPTSYQQVKKDDEQTVSEGEQIIEQVIGKLRLIDVLNLISNRELKDNTKVIFEGIELTYRNGDLEDEGGYSITCIINNTSDLLTDVELILPEEPIKSNEKLAKLDLGWLLYQSTPIILSEITKKINEIVDYINEVEEDEQPTK